MTANISTALVTQFSDQVHVNAQQMRSRLRDKVEVKPVSGEDFAYDGIGDLEAIEITQRHQKTQGQDIAHTRRQIKMREFRATIYLDRKDSLETLIDPQRQYSMAVARAMFRKFDAIAIEAALASVKTGKDFGTTVTAADDGVLTVDATGGTTYAKLKELNTNFMNNDVGNDLPEDIFLAITGDEHDDLLSLTELTSGDYVRDYAVEDGRLARALGMQLVPFASNASNPILTVSGGTRDCVAASTRGICVGMSKELEVEVDKRPDLNNLTQVQSSMFLGGVRTEGVLVQKFQTTAS